MPASVTIRSRVDSTDLLRGTVMILMALDHTQDFFSAAGMNPRDVTGPALFTNSRSSSKPFGRRKYTLRSDRGGADLSGAPASSTAALADLDTR